MERWIPMEQKLQRVDQVLYEMGLKSVKTQSLEYQGKSKASQEERKNAYHLLLR
jgi:hypothetical protein